MQKCFYYFVWVLIHRGRLCSVIATEGKREYDMAVTLGRKKTTTLLIASLKSLRLIVDNKIYLSREHLTVLWVLSNCIHPSKHVFPYYLLKCMFLFTKTFFLNYVYI